MTRFGRNDANVPGGTPREQSCTAETVSTGLDVFTGNRPTPDVTTCAARMMLGELTTQPVV